MDSGDEEDGGVGEAMEVLSLTRWDSDLHIVKEARLRLYTPLGLTPPETATKLKVAATTATSLKVNDEHESYASLVDTVGY
mmetsp:Transcript_20936/g.28971  ORF Transcript_20936/g.28971 Transcript_20936/m.28971 type:complete len:81 (-) Transcript_20936:175-417(-)